VSKAHEAIVSATAGFAFPTERFFWSVSFIYACFMALLLQKAVLPLWPEMHAGHGLLMNDAIVFHNMAVEIAERIRSVGWSEWKIYPHGAAANVGLLSLLYALLGPDPAWFIPFNAVAHATGALLIYRMGVRLVDGGVGKLGGLLAAICFLVFPSALQWYGQNHKDAFAIAGLLLLLDAWLVLHDDHFRNGLRNILGILFLVLLGTVLLGLVRPYFVVIAALGFFISFLIASVWRSRMKFAATRLGFVAVVAFLAVVFVRYGTAEAIYRGSPEVLNIVESEKLRWKESDWMPSTFDKTLQRASELRIHFIYFGRSVGAGSEIDGNRLPNTALTALAYMPRALFVGLFAPFPDMWGERVTLPRLIGAMETACWYLAFLGVIVSVARHRNRKMLAGAVFCATLIAVLAYIHPNLGTLYRQRFGLWHFFMLLGCLGWASFFLRRLSRHHNPEFVTPLDDVLQEKRSIRLTVADSISRQGSVVILITLTCYLGFFARDLLLTGQLGLGGKLDAFFAAAMIPMFFVSCLAIPIGDALVPPFISAQYGAHKSNENLMRGTLSLAFLLLVGVTFFVLLGAPWLVSLVLQTATEEVQGLAVSLVRWFAPIIMLSAWTVVGNAALNSLFKPLASARAQLAVPVMTLSAMVLAPSEHIMFASIGGMLLGTLINALFVFWQLRVSGLLLLPGKAMFTSTYDVRRLYLPLVAAAVLPAAVIPMNYAFAASVSQGMAAAWGFASKVVILFSGLASVGVTTVVLPRLVDLICTGGARAGRDANLLIALGIWLGGLLMLGGFLFAEPLIAILLGKGLSVAEVGDLALIAKIGMMQIPVVIVGVLVHKLALATGLSSRIMYSSVLAFASNLAINFFLVPKIGVLGVAIGVLSGGVIGLIVLLKGVHRQIDLSLQATCICLVCWLAWIVVCIGLLFESVAAVIVAIVLLGLMALLQIIFLRQPSSVLNAS